MEPKITPGLKTLKNGPRTFLEAPRPEPVTFFAPGGLQERSGADFYSAQVASWHRLGPSGASAPHCRKACV